MIGAVIIAIFSAKICLWINAFSFFISVLILWSLKLPEPKLSKRDLEDLNLRASIKSTFSVLTQQKRLRLFLVFSLLALIILMICESQMVILLKSLYPSRPNLLGYVIGTSGVGAILMGLILGKIKNLKNYFPLLALSLISMALGYGLVGLIPMNASLIYLLLISLIQGFGFGGILVLYSYVIKREVPEKILGRVYGTLGMFQSIMLLIGSALGGFLVSGMGASHTYFLMGCVALVLTLGVFIKRRCL